MLSMYAAISRPVLPMIAAMGRTVKKAGKKDYVFSLSEKNQKGTHQTI